MAVTLGPFPNPRTVLARIQRTGILSRPTMHHPGAIDPILALRQRGIIAGPTTDHPPGPVTGGNKRRP